MNKKRKDDLKYYIYEIICEALPVDKIGEDLATPITSKIIELLKIYKVL